MNQHFITSRLAIPDSELEWTYVRSSGPGGQNVNRTNSCAVVRWNYLNSEALRTIAPSETVLEKLKSQATKEGDIILKSQNYRDQERNYQDCLQKLIALIKGAFYQPKKRVPTKPTRSSKRRRLQNKKLHSEKKMSRRRDSYED